MANEPKDGGVAFPSPISCNQSGDVEFAAAWTGFGGMSLRDYFAAKAMQAYLTTNMDGSAHNDQKCATWSYQTADAMLAVRAAEPPQ